MPASCIMVQLCGSQSFSLGRCSRLICKKASFQKQSGSSCVLAASQIHPLHLVKSLLRGVRLVSPVHPFVFPHKLRSSSTPHFLHNCTAVKLQLPKVFLLPYVMRWKLQLWSETRAVEKTKKKFTIVGTRGMSAHLQVSSGSAGVSLKRFQTLSCKVVSVVWG